MIREVNQQDAPAITTIYNYYIENTIVTFEETPLDTSEMAARIKSTTGKLPWIVYEKDGIVVGYAYASEWKSRCSYRYSLETTVYLKHGKNG